LKFLPAFFINKERILTIHRWTPALVFVAALAGLSQKQPAAKPVSPAAKTSTQASRSRAVVQDKSAQNDAELEKAIRARFARSKASPHNKIYFVLCHRLSLTCDPAGSR
jgi:hypothetical protein